MDSYSWKPSSWSNACGSGRDSRGDRGYTSGGYLQIHSMPLAHLVVVAGATCLIAAAGGWRMPDSSGNRLLLAAMSAFSGVQVVFLRIAIDLLPTDFP